MADKKTPAVLASRQLRAQALRFSLQEEMAPLLQRVSGNKSKRTASTLVKQGPMRVLLVALDKGGKLEEHAVSGPFSVQCLLGCAKIRLGSREEELHAGGLLVVDAGITHDVEALEASALLITIVMEGGV
jgi:quercetin dioxygenase-like cupin family protein